MDCHKVHCRVIGVSLLPTVGGFIGGVVVRRNISPFYTGLKKPTWTPPNHVFPPLWAAIHTGIGFASYLVYRDGGGFDGPARVPLIWYGTNLALNLSWAPIFFGLQNLDVSFLGIKLVTATALITGHSFYKINKNAGYLFIPYVLWLGFASVLMFNIHKLNKKAVKGEK